MMKCFATLALAGTAASFEITATTYSDAACTTVKETTVTKSVCEDKTGSILGGGAYKSYKIGGSCSAVTANGYPEVQCAGTAMDDALAAGVANALLLTAGTCR
jgi:hypothetical protein